MKKVVLIVFMWNFVLSRCRQLFYFCLWIGFSCSSQWDWIFSELLGVSEAFHLWKAKYCHWSLTLTCSNPFNPPSLPTKSITSFDTNVLSMFFASSDQPVLLLSSALINFSTIDDIFAVLCFFDFMWSFLLFLFGSACFYIIPINFFT